VGAELSAGYFAVSPTGVLAYRTGAAATAGFQHTWFDRQGKATGTFGELNNDSGVRLSPDGTRAAERDATQQTRGDIWLLDFARGVRTRLTFRQNLGSNAVWSTDGSRIAFSSGDSLDTIYEKSASGAGEEKELLKKPGQIMAPSSWSQDGRFLLYTLVNGPKSGADLWVLPLEGDRKAVPLLATDFNEAGAMFSTDGRWVTYMSNESGRNEVYVRPFVASGPSGPSLGEGKWQVSKDGGTNPKWRADGKEIIFNFTFTMLSVDVNGSSAGFQMGTPKQLFRVGNNGWDVSSDGKQFMMLVPPNQGQQTGSTPITVVLNWQADLKK
jgi:dipeptidyl aminopeptidase/acylaminoacyl peptidase